MSPCVISCSLYTCRWKYAKALPGANRLIKHLHDHGVPTALASNSLREYIDAKISPHQGWFLMSFLLSWRGKTNIFGLYNLVNDKPIIYQSQSLTRNGKATICYCFLSYYFYVICLLWFLISGYSSYICQTISK